MGNVGFASDDDARRAVDTLNVLSSMFLNPFPGGVPRSTPVSGMVKPKAGSAPAGHTLGNVCWLNPATNTYASFGSDILIRWATGATIDTAAEPFLAQYAGAKDHSGTTYGVYAQPLSVGGGGANIHYISGGTGGTDFANLQYSNIQNAINIHTNVGDINEPGWYLISVAVTANVNMGAMGAVTAGKHYVLRLSATLDDDAAGSSGTYIFYPWNSPQYLCDAHLVGVSGFGTGLPVTASGSATLWGVAEVDEGATLRLRVNWIGNECQNGTLLTAAAWSLQKGSATFRAVRVPSFRQRSGGGGTGAFGDVP